MDASALLDVILRWAHVIAGIMWIGNSMLFNWLDRNLERTAGDGKLSQGKIYMVHSGAFYEVEKKLLEPGELPTTLHWFMWQNFSTWATGIALLVVVYFLHGAAFLIDPSVRMMSQGEAIGWSLGSLVAAWAVYDGLWMSIGRRAPAVATALSFAMLLGAAYGYSILFSGRAAYLQTGVLIGTVMTGNVWMRILPSQKSLIAATKAGQEQDATLSLRAKQRSIHNNYLTFPLLFIMVSNHFPMTYGHHLRWPILVAVMIGGAGVRHFMNVRYDRVTVDGVTRPRLGFAGWFGPGLGMAAVGIAGLMILTRIDKAPAIEVKTEVTFARAQEIIVTRCAQCHSAKPSDPVFTVAPVNVVFDTPERIRAMAARIKDRAVTNRTMPFNNQTQMTETERAELGAWIDQGAKLQ